jgi:hypothetical protein
VYKIDNYSKDFLILSYDNITYDNNGFQIRNYESLVLKKK